MGTDPTSLEQIWLELWRPLCRRLQHRFPLASTDHIADAATDAILTCIAKPHAFDPARQVPFDAFVFGIAVRVLRDRVRTERRRTVRESDYAIHRQVSESPIHDRATSQLLKQEIRSALALVCSPVELSTMDACLDGADTNALAARLGISHLPRVEQLRIVRRLWDAVIKRLKHAARGVADIRRRLRDGPVTNTTRGAAFTAVTTTQAVPGRTVLRDASL